MTRDLRLTTRFLFCFSLFTIHFSLLEAQDTAKPVIMSQSAYDSILNALKKGAKQKDTANHLSPNQNSNVPIPPPVVDTNRHRALRMSPDVMVNDTANMATMKHAMDSALAKLRADSLYKVAHQMHRDDSIAKASADSNRKKALAFKYLIRPASTGYIALNIGIASPVSDFATIGAASLGRNFSVSAEFPGQKSRFGWAFKLDYGYNGINANQYLHIASEYVQTYDQSLVYTYLPQGGNYTYYSMMIGMCKSFPLGKVTIDARMLIGVLSGTIPQTSYKVLDETNWNTITVNSYKSSAGSFAFNFGLDVRYLILPNLSVLLNFDYLTARPTFQVVSSGFTASYSGIVPVAAQLSSFTQGFILNNLTLGVGYTITAKKVNR